MTVYRCSLAKWAADLSGTGAYLYGGRWNTRGTPLLYTAENNVLAAFEVALRIPLDQISKNYVMIPIDIPDDAEVFTPRLPTNWYTDAAITQKVGDQFAAAAKHLLMKVPSALMTDAYNYLINPAHPLMRNVRAQAPRPILFDKRLTDMIRRAS